MKTTFRLLYEPVTDTTTGGGAGPVSTAGASSDNPFVETPTSDATQTSTTPSGSKEGQQIAQTASTTTQQQQPAASQSPQGQQTQQTPQQVQTPTTLTPEQIANIAAAAAARVQPQAAPQQQQAPQQMSQEEFNKTFNVATVTPETFTAIMGFAPEKPEQIQALQAYGQALVKQSLTMANVQIQSIVQSLRNEFGQSIAPLTAQREAQVGEQLKGEFFTQYPDLKELEPLVTEVATQLQASGKKLSKEEAFKFVAEKTRSLVPASWKPSTTGQQAPATQQTQQPAQRQMTPTSVGGQVSTSSGSATTKTNDAKAIFG